jgi:hypothetical protein
MSTSASSLFSLTALAALTMSLAAGIARADTFATITPTLSPERLGAKTAMTLRIQYAGGEHGVPNPVRRSVLLMPAGLTLDVPSLSSCSATRLQSAGASACPRQSYLGAGEALAEVHAGLENLAESATLWAFLGPPDNLQPTFEILAEGYTPINERVVISGTALPASPPYGEELVISTPPIPTLGLEPDASVADFSLTIGASALRRSTRRTRSANALLLPDSCPTGGFPFAAEFDYADGSQSSSSATVPCP